MFAVLCGNDGDGCAPTRERRLRPPVRPGEVICRTGRFPGEPELQQTASKCRPMTPLRVKPWQVDTFPGSRPTVSRRTRWRRLKHSGTANVDRDALGDSFPCTGAAAMLDDVPGRGLCVPFQRGLGACSSDAVAGGNGSLPKATGPPLPMIVYEPCQDDPIDRAFATAVKKLDPVKAQFLFVRRVSPGEYDIGGTRVFLRFAGSGEQIFVDVLGQDDPIELAPYLSFELNFAAKFSGSSFESSPAFRNSVQPRSVVHPASIPVIRPPAAVQNYSREVGSFYSGGASVLASAGSKDLRLGGAIPGSVTPLMPHNVPFTAPARTTPGPSIIRPPTLGISQGSLHLPVAASGFGPSPPAQFVSLPLVRMG